MDLFWLGGEGPKDIPGWISLYLLNTLELPAEKLTGLRSVQKTGFWEGKPVFFIRIYNPSASEEAWQVKDFNSLDEQPHLILYEGHWERDSYQVYLERKTAPKPQSQSN